ncbi:hypothetical protein ID866_9844 [Astraeus odoratus]|nr:hypothetical protein ID866_9844 [Astraeus odoratus]
MNLQGEQVMGPGSPRSPSSPTLSDSSLLSQASALSLKSEVTTVPPYVPDEYEKLSYYNGITSDGDHPILIYRSDYHSTPFPKPSGRFASPCQASCPSSTSPDLAHAVSQKILALLQKNGIRDVVVEFREAETQQLIGPPLLRHVGTANATHHVRGFLTALLGVPLTTQDWERDDGQGTLTLWFHEIIDKSGKPSDRVLGLTCCHVLRRNTTTKYELKGGAAKNLVRVCGTRRFLRGLDDITKAISDHGILAEYYARDIARLQAMEEQDDEARRELRRLRPKLEEEKEAVDDLEAFYDEVTKQWSDGKLQRNIGYAEYAPAISVAKDTQYTLDWGVFVAAEAKVRPQFEGNVVDLGSKYSPQDLNSMFYPVPGGPTTFKFPDQRKLRIVACATEDDLAHPAEFDADGVPCLMVGKDGNTTGLTVGRYAGIVSFLENAAGVVSRELGIYNTGLKAIEPFSEKGDSGSLIWHMYDGQARMVGQLHSGRNKGGSTGNHLTYATPAWYLLKQVKTEYKHADFYRSAWSA